MWYCKGFTLIELMITLAIGAIVLAAGAPMFKTAVENNRLVTATNALVADIAHARSEAVRQGKTVKLCLWDASATPPACHTSGSNFTGGWVVVIDGETTPLRKSSTTAPTIGIYSNSNPSLTISQIGMVTPNSVVFRVCSDGTATSSVPGRQLTMSSTGQITITKSDSLSCDFS